jgi:hypothetical protein
MIQKVMYFFTIGISLLKCIKKVISIRLEKDSSLCSERQAVLGLIREGEEEGRHGVPPPLPLVSHQLNCQFRMDPPNGGGMRNLLTMLPNNQIFSPLEIKGVITPKKKK